MKLLRRVVGDESLRLFPYRHLSECPKRIVASKPFDDKIILW